MKKLLSICALALAINFGQTQGTINFGNFNGGSIDAPISGPDGFTRLEGDAALAQLYVQINGNFQSVGAALPFFSGAGAGYIDNSSGSDRVVSGIPGGMEAIVQLRVWITATGASYETATQRGYSNPFAVILGGAGAPPSLPADLVGIENFTWEVVPEPSTIALAMLGGAALFLRRRK